LKIGIPSYRIQLWLAVSKCWNWVMNASKLDLSPAGYEMGALPAAPVAVPGKTELI
jgi:hypothetical protein